MIGPKLVFFYRIQFKRLNFKLVYTYFIIKTGLELFFEKLAPEIFNMFIRQVDHDETSFKRFSPGKVDGLISISAVHFVLAMDLELLSTSAACYLRST